MKNLKDLAKITAEKLGVPKRATHAIVEEFLEQIAAALERGEPVQLIRFGEFFFTMGPFNNQKFYEMYGATLPETEEGEGLRLKICRFRFRDGIRKRVNGFVKFRPGDKERIDYKGGGKAPAPAAETNRRARAGITMGAICGVLNEEARRGPRSR